MIRYLSFLLVTFSILALSMPSLAQDNMGSKERRLELAKQMNDIRPARTQVDEALKVVSKGLPPLERERLAKLVERAFDYQALEKLSIETMAELFSEVELEKMVAYFGSPEARAISAKLPQYQEKLQPEIIRMLDAALMVEKTGGRPDKVDVIPPEAPADATGAVTVEKSP